MPKGGSGFGRASRYNAGLLQRGGSSGPGGRWRMADPTRYTKEIESLYRSMYRSGIVMNRDRNGRLLSWGGSDEAILNAGERIQALADRMAADVQVYNQGAAEAYGRLRQQWGRSVYVNSRDMAEVRSGMRQNERLLVNTRGRRGVSQDAAARAEATGYRANGYTNADILSQANREMNATRNSIWQSVRGTGMQGAIAGELTAQLAERYEKTERSAWKRRKNR